MPVPEEETLFAGFASCARDLPHQAALLAGGRVMTYREVAAAVSATASRLLAAGVKAGDLVPVVSRGGAELPVGMLAAWACSAAFVPIDADWPEVRIAAVLAELGPDVLLADRESVSCLPAVHASDAVVIDVSAGGGAVLSELPSGGAPDADGTAYGFFTSGSTGTPKCCLNTHRGLVNRFRVMSATFGLRPGEVVLQNSRHVFDSSLWQTLWPLTVGGTVLIPERENLLDLDATLDQMERHAVAMTDFVPSVFNLLCRMIEADPGKAAKLSSLRHILIGGEAVSSRAVQTFRRLVPGTSICNTYGPTEAAIGMVFHEVRDEDGDDIPLGTPIANTFAIVTDRDLRPLPRGEVGQVVIGGVCIGKGYLGSPDKTAQAFLPNPFPDLPGPVVYLTGDLGHVDREGRLRFDGREDAQVKINGIRIDLGEIVSAVESADGISQAAVLPVARPDGSAYLVAFLVPSGGAGGNAPDHGALAAHLAGILPSGTIPTRFVDLDRLPLLANGKLDRRALRDAVFRSAPADGRSADELVAGLVELWTASLDLPAGPDTDFFAAGGDSLAVVNLVLNAKQRLGLAIDAQWIYSHPTPAGVAAILKEGVADADVRQRERERLSILADLDRARSIFRHAGSDLPRPVAKDDETILLTGATGYVGAHLLRSLLDLTSARIRCLVRAESDARAFTRILGAFGGFGLARHGLAERVEAVATDLGECQLGLSATRYERMAEGVVAIVHAGAEVHLLHGYEALRETNVAGTFELLRVAAALGGVPIHFVSTLGVIAGGPGAGGDPVREHWLINPFDGVAGDGYSRSKAVAEIGLGEAMLCGQPVWIHRLGEVMPAMEGGTNPRSLVHLLLAAVARLGMAPDVPLAFDYTPVDTLCRLIARAPFELSGSGVLHLFNPARCDLQVARRLLGRDARGAEPVAYAVFLDHLRALARQEPRNQSLHHLLAMLPEASPAGDEADRAWFERRFRHPGTVFDRRGAAALERRLGLSWPDVTQATLAAFRASIGDGRAPSVEEAPDRMPGRLIA